jgi:hypothetical protein
MPLVFKRGRGPAKAPDLNKFYETLTHAQIALLVNLFEYIVESRDSEGVLEFYNAAQLHWNGMTPDERRAGAKEGEERFFTEEAYEQHRSRHASDLGAARAADEQVLTEEELEEKWGPN